MRSHLTVFAALSLLACAPGPAPQAALPVAPPPVAANSVAPPPVGSTPPTPSTRWALVHASVLDVAQGTMTPDRAIVLDADQIVAVLPSAELPSVAPARVVDVGGKYVIPGLWDMHVHFGDPASPKAFVANGVAGVRVMWGNPKFGPGMDHIHFDMRDAFDKKQQVGPRMVIASNIMDGPKPIWPNSLGLGTPEEGRKAVDDAKASGVDFIKVYSLLPRDVYFAIAQESKQVGLPFAGHVPESVTVAEASDAGQKSIEHLTGMLVACSSREAALRKKEKDFADKGDHSPAEWRKFHRAQAAEAIATYDAQHAATLFQKLIANGTWQTPTLTVLSAMATITDPSHAQDPRLQYVSTFMRRSWDPSQDFRLKSQTPADYAAARAELKGDVALVGAMNQAGVPMLAGTDELNPYCFAGFGLHDELELLVKAGLSPAQALRAATLGPARYLGHEATMGSVAEGRVADLVILDADPLADITNTRKIQAVVSRGVFYDRPALDKLLEDVKSTASHPQFPGGGG